MTENLDAFLTDFGVPVVFGSAEGLGILDLPDSTVGGLSISTDISLLVKASDFSLSYDDVIQVNDTEYKVREYKLLDDGLFARATLSLNE